MHLHRTGHEGRFRPAIGASRTKDGQNPAGLFRATRRRTGSCPLITVGDSLEVMGNGHHDAFGANCSVPVRCARIRNRRRTNNRHERFNSALRRMVYGRRSRLPNVVIGAAWLYCNCPRMALGDITPAQKAGVFIAGPNRLMTLIQNAAMSKFTIPHPQWTENLEKACRAA